MALTLLYTKSQTTNGCDRLFVDGDAVIVQGTHVAGRGEYAGISVPEDETLVAVSREAILAAAQELERQ